MLDCRKHVCADPKENEQGRCWTRRRSHLSTKRGLRRWGEKLLYTDIAQRIND